ncbi:uncharacterized protein LOC117344735 [Pecten maximus]|uniref:uncharacterized protein LOC117321107 n=1 Tax=Pecten maximus TaxID=6579 RepID=UPI00145846D5|nr:uncharacterized protein LOC117321107 [Pecten maximus]XP_033763453.1 uncharacterized protein LOC117344735 [Pecten maximus]
MINLVATTPINIETLHHELRFHPDKQFVSELVNGLRTGFNTGFLHIPEVPFQCRNLRSALRESETVTSLIQKEVDKGFLLGPFKSVPFKHSRINPIGIAEHKYSKKKCLIVDMSAPHDDPENPSLNSLIDKDTYSLKYVKIDDAISLIKKLGKDTWLIKTDISDAFKLLPIKPSLWPLHGISWEGDFYFFVRLVFGSRSSPKIFDNLSEAICWIARHMYRIKHVLHLLDDFIVLEPKLADAQDTMTKFLRIFHNLGVPIALHKTAGPCTCLEYLGVCLDSEKMEARLPVEKIDRIREILNSFSQRKTCTKRELLSLLGHMNFASRVIRPGRSFVSHLIKLSTSVSKLHHHVTLTSAVRSDLVMWSNFLSSWNGVSFFMDDNITLAADIYIFTDSTCTSFGGIHGASWFQGYFPAVLLQEKQSMALLELYPIVMACVLWGHLWSRKRILFYCDNMATVEIISKGRSKIPSIMKLMRRLTFHTAKHNFIIHAQHIMGTKNLIADALSRWQMKKFRELAPFADKQATPCRPVQELLME